MRAAAAYLSRYDIERHIADMLPTYRHQRDLMLATMEEHFPAGITWTRAEGRPVHLGDVPAAARRRGVPTRRPDPPRRGHRRAGTPFFADRPEANHARMSFSGVPDARLVAGVRAMGGLLAEALA